MTDRDAAPAPLREQVARAIGRTATDSEWTLWLDSADAALTVVRANLPDPAYDGPTDDEYGMALADGWNSCLDEIERLSKGE